MARHALLAYDIASDARRRAVLRVLKRWRLDGQKSVHECRLDAQQATELYLQVVEMVCIETDRVLLVWMEGSGARHRFGKAKQSPGGLLRSFR